MKDEYAGCDNTQERVGEYNIQLDSLYAIAKEMEKRLEPVLRMSELKSETESGSDTPLSRELKNVVFRFEDVLSRISL